MLRESSSQLINNGTAVSGGFTADNQLSKPYVIIKAGGFGVTNTFTLTVTEGVDTAVYTAVFTLTPSMFDSEKVLLLSVPAIKKGQKVSAAVTGLTGVYAYLNNEV